MRSTTLTLALMACCSASAADWPQFRGPNRDNISQETGLLKEWPKDGPKLLWTVEESGVGYGDPAVVGDAIYLLGAEDAKQGKKEFLLRLAAKDGKTLWKADLNDGKTPGGYLDGWGAGPRATPTVDGDKIYALGARGDLGCYDAKAGKKVWHVNLVADLKGKIPGWGYSESVLIDGNRLICTPGGEKGFLAALDKKTGKVLARSDSADGAAYSSIIIIEIGGAKQYVTMSPKGVCGFDAKTLKQLWTSKAGANGVAVIPTPVFDGKNVFASSGYGSGCGLVSLVPKGGKTEYLSKLFQNHHGGFVRVGDFVYGHSDKGGWICVDYKKESEDPVWKTSTLDKGSVTCADNMLFMYGEGKGVCVLAEVNSEKFVEKGRFEIPTKSKIDRRQGHIWSHPVVANGVLYLRDQEVLMAFAVK